MELQFEKDLQAAADEGEKKKLAKENEAFRAQIQKMKIAAKNPARSAKDEKLIDNLRRKVGKYNFDLNKAESELTRARKQLAKNSAERARLVKQLKEKYDNEVAGLKKRVIATENKMIKQSLMKILNKAHVPDKISVNHLEKIANKIFEVNRVTFSDDELPVKGTEHIKALYLTVKCEDSVVTRVLIDNGSSANICPLSTLSKLKVEDERIHKNNISFSPVKQKLRKFKTDMSVKIKEEITKQLDEKVIRVTRYLVWLANV
ncbi:uncharacterized protein [Nicotiana sylvestris]|uniref:uncharacterized protein n=1 Tax=Nicotiana sylvestris TaxID=4096 RepID=UPI00388C929A